MGTIYIPSKQEIEKKQIEDKIFAEQLISKYFAKIIPSNYKFDPIKFEHYEEIAKRYAILEVLITHKNKINKLSLITLIKGL